jgi:hypothetical protein
MPFSTFSAKSKTAMEKQRPQGTDGKLDIWRPAYFVKALENKKVL